MYQYDKTNMDGSLQTAYKDATSVSAIKSSIIINRLNFYFILYNNMCTYNTISSHTDRFRKQ